MLDERVFGPVPSRRLGISLGVNNIPPKICSYSCVYCQIGRSLELTAERRAFYQPDELAREVENTVKKLRLRAEKPDFLTIVPDGEPTLDINLGKLIKALKRTGIRVAVITNATLLDDQEVRTDLLPADLVSVKVDAVDPQTWKDIDRPYGRLNLSRILAGIHSFSEEYQGSLLTETMLVQGLNDSQTSLQATADFIQRLDPDRSYLSIPTRPPAEDWVSPPGEEIINTAFQIFSGAGLNTEYLIGYEGNAFSSCGDIKKDLLSILAVHPMREDAVKDLLQRAGDRSGIIKDLIAQDKITAADYRGHLFYLRKFNRGKQKRAAR